MKMKVRFSAMLGIIALGLALGGCSSSNLVSADEMQRKEAEDLQNIQNKIAKDKKVDPIRVSVEDIQKDPKVKDLGLDKPDDAPMIERALSMDLDNLPPVQKLEGYKKIDFNDKNNPVMKFAAMKMDRTPTTPAGPTYVDFKTAFQNATLQVLDVKITNTPPPPVAEKGKPTPPPQQPTVRELFVGPIDKKFADEQIKMAQQNKSMKIEVLKTYPVALYANDKGRVVAVVESGFKNPQRIAGGGNLMYYKQSAEVLNKLEEERKTNMKLRMPMPISIGVAVAK